MRYDSIVISSGHSTHVRGANGVLDEVTEARKVAERLGEELGHRGVDVTVFHDQSSTTQGQNLKAIVAFHNGHDRDLDVSVHFNASKKTDKPMGAEVLYKTQSALASEVSAAIASCGLKNRGPKKRPNLAFLNSTKKPAILIEVCFVDSTADAEIYRANFDRICTAIADVLSGVEVSAVPPEPLEPLVQLRGKVSWFGGPDDLGVDPDEPLAFIYDVDDAPHLFLPEQPPDTTGLARRLDPTAFYIACRWDYDVTPKPSLLEHVALVRAPRTGLEFTAFPADWGPHGDTDRVADISPGLMEALGIQTDDEVEVTYPYEPKVG